MCTVLTCESDRVNCLQRFQIYVPMSYAATAGAHLYFVPQVGLDCNLDTPTAEDACNFMWSSAPYPIQAFDAVSHLTGKNRTTMAVGSLPY